MLNAERKSELTKMLSSWHALLLSNGEIHFLWWYRESIVRFILGCQAIGYSFRRSRRIGIPTLEYTYMAIESVHRLLDLETKIRA